MTIFGKNGDRMGKREENKGKENRNNKKPWSLLLSLNTSDSHGFYHDEDRGG